MNYCHYVICCRNKEFISPLTLSSISVTMASRPPPPDPVFYLSLGEAVTCLCLKHNTLIAGTASGGLVTYSAVTWKQTSRIQAFRLGAAHSNKSKQAP